MDGLKFQEVIDEIKDLVRGSWRYRWQAISIAWVVCMIVWVLVLLMPDVYRASSRLHIDSDDSLMRTLDGMAIETDFLEEVNVMLQSILSRPALERIATVSGYDLGDPDPAEVDALIRRLADRLEIDLDRDQVLEIAIEHSNRNVAYAVVDVVIKMFVEDFIGSTGDDDRTAQDFLQKKLAEYEGLLSDSEARLAEFKKNNIGLMPGESGGYYDRLQDEILLLEDLDSRLRLARQRRDTLALQMEGEEPVFGMVASGGQVVTSPQIELLEQQLTDLRLQYTDAHPDVVRTQELLDELREKLAGVQPQSTVTASDDVERNPVYQQIKIQFSQAELELSQLQIERTQQARLVQDLRQRIDTIPEIEAELTRLNRNYDVYRAQHTELVERLEKARMSEDVKKSTSGLQFRVIDPPSVGSKPVGPNRRLLATVGLLFALGLGVAFAGVRSLAAPVFYSGERLERLFGMRVLGAIKMARTDEERRRARLGTVVLSISMACLFACYMAVMLFDRVGAQLAGRVVGLFG